MLKFLIHTLNPASLRPHTCSHQTAPNFLLHTCTPTKQIVAPKASHYVGIVLTVSTGNLSTPQKVAAVLKTGVSAISPRAAAFFGLVASDHFDVSAVSMPVGPGAPPPPSPFAQAIGKLNQTILGS